MTAALEGGEWSAARPGRTLPPGKSRYPFYRRLGGLQGRSGRAENLVSTGIRTQTVQPVVSHYTDWATRPITIIIIIIITCNAWEKVWMSRLWSLVAFKCWSVRNWSHILYHWTADLIFMHPWIHSLCFKLTNRFEFWSEMNLKISSQFLFVIGPSFAPTQRNHEIIIFIVIFFCFLNRFFYKTSEIYDMLKQLVNRDRSFPLLFDHVKFICTDRLKVELASLEAWAVGCVISYVLTLICCPRHVYQRTN